MLILSKTNKMSEMAVYQLGCHFTLTISHQSHFSHNLPVKADNTNEVLASSLLLRDISVSC